MRASGDGLRPRVLWGAQTRSASTSSDLQRDRLYAPHRVAITFTHPTGSSATARRLVGSMLYWETLWPEPEFELVTYALRPSGAIGHVVGSEARGAPVPSGWPPHRTGALRRLAACGGHQRCLRRDLAIGGERRVGLQESDRSDVRVPARRDAERAQNPAPVGGEDSLDDSGAAFPFTRNRIHHDRGRLARIRGKLLHGVAVDLVLQVMDQTAALAGKALGSPPGH